MAEESWNAARLIPTSGINGAEEQERRATSALLAVLTAVKEFGRTLLAPYGAPAGAVETYIEVPFVVGDTTLYPDGLIRVVRGKRSWTALVEVKTGTNELQAPQLEAYLDIAKQQGFDAVLTISNEVPPAPGQHPTSVDKRKLRKVGLHHVSWLQVMAEAVMQRQHRGVADPDQAWILEELIRYLEHPRSGAMAFEDMGSHWVAVRDAVKAGTLRTSDKGVAEVAGRFDATLRYVGLRLGQRLGADVHLVLSKKEQAEPSARSQAVVSALVDRGVMSGVLRIPDAAATLHVSADLRAGELTCHCELRAPEQGRPRTRVNWLVRQLRDAPDHLRVEAFVLHGRGASTAELLGAVRADPDVLVSDKSKEIRNFNVTQASSLGTKRGKGRGGFIDSVADAVDRFYAEVLQNLKTWTPAAPRLREDPDKPDVTPALVSTALSSQDDADRGPGQAPKA